MLSPLPSAQSTKPANTDTINIIAKQEAGIPYPRHSSDWLLLSMDRGGNVPHHMQPTKSARVLKWLDSVVATHGGPNTLQTDKGSYFTSAEFRNTLKAWEIEPRTVTEYWPQANGLVERFNKVLLKFIQTLLAKGKKWKKYLMVFIYLSKGFRS